MGGRGAKTDTVLNETQNNTEQQRKDFINKVKEINKRAREKEKMRQKIKSYINGDK